MIAIQLVRDFTSCSRYKIHTSKGRLLTDGADLKTLHEHVKRGASLKIKGKIYRACVQSGLVYGTETWAMKVDDMKRLERSERMMVRWMCGVSLRDRKSSVVWLERLSVVGVTWQTSVVWTLTA